MATEYVTLSVDIHFEPGHVACAYCPLLQEAPRWQCRRTGEYLTEIKYVVGRWCPLEEKHEEMPEV